MQPDQEPNYDPDDIAEQIRQRDEERAKKYEEWSQMSIREKLSTYGHVVLSYLAYLKWVPDWHLLTREQTIDFLEPLTTPEDFPILYPKSAGTSNEWPPDWPLRHPRV